MPKLTGDLLGVPNGEVWPRVIPAGTACPPEMEAAARATGVLETTAERKARKEAEAAAARAQAALTVPPNVAAALNGAPEGAALDAPAEGQAAPEQAASEPPPEQGV